MQETYADEEIEAILAAVKSFVIVGASANPVRSSFIVAKYLLGKGYAVHLVNPGLAGQTVLGLPVFAKLADVPAAECVDVFRNSEAALGVTREAIALKDKLGIKVVWMQLGVRNEDAAREAEAAGLKVVMNRCPKIEYGRLSGEIGWLGINSGRLTSRRPQLSPAGIQSLSINRKA